MNATTVAVSTLQDTIRRALDRFPAERARIERAATLVALGHVEPIGETSAWVRSQTGRGTYLVTPGACNCEDQARRPELTCKHRWAASLLRIAQQRQAVLDERARLAATFTSDELERLVDLKRRHQAVA